MKSFPEALEDSGLVVQSGKIVLPSECKRVKLDVGLSSNAPQSKVWLEQDPNCIVFGFEPVAENRRHILSGTGRSSSRIDTSLVGSRFFLLPFALGNVLEPTEVPCYVPSGDTGCSSLLLPRTFPVAYVDTVTIRPLSEFLEFFPFEDIPLIDHLKTDCQGTDLDVLKGARQFLSRFRAITAESEVRQYMNARNSLRATSWYLARRGFFRLLSNHRRSLPNVLAQALFDPLVPLGLAIEKLTGPIAQVFVEDATWLNVRGHRSTERKELKLFQVG